MIRGNGLGWTSAAGPRRDRTSAALLIAAFVAWERAHADPMLPLRLFRRRAFRAANVASLF